MPRNLRFPLKLFFRDKIILFSTVLSFLENLGIWVYLPIYLKNKEQLVFLHYTVHLGVDLVGSWQQIFSLPLIGLLFLAINLILAYLLYYDKFFSRLIMVGTVILEMVLGIAAVFLVFLNF